MNESPNFKQNMKVKVFKSNIMKEMKWELLYPYNVLVYRKITYSRKNIFNSALKFTEEQRLNRTFSLLSHNIFCFHVIFSIFVENIVKASNAERLYCLSFCHNLSRGCILQTLFLVSCKHSVKRQIVSVSRYLLL